MSELLRVLQSKKVFFALTILVVALDQVTKFFAVEHLQGGMRINILPILNFSLAYNYGAAFSFLNDAGGWQRWFFIVFVSFVCCFIFAEMIKEPASKRLLLCAYALILGGGLGNLIDRCLLGYVVDFISVHYQHYYFPTFNIADSAISIGAVCFIVSMLLTNQTKTAHED